MYSYSFGSDNHSGAHPAVLKKVQECNTGFCSAYGEDEITEQAIALFKKHFGHETTVHFLLTGTGANVTGLQSVSQSFHSILASDMSHLNMDECGAPEKHTGSKLVTIPHVEGKLTVENIKPQIFGIGFVHHSQPKVISITQTTEYGTCYTVNEIKAIVEFAHSNNMLVHLDGARISNAAVTLGLDFKTFTFDIGVDIVSFGGTKNGLMIGEAVLFRNQTIEGHFPYFRKQNMQLASKMRFISAQFLAFFEKDLWLKNAKNANQMAAYLKKSIENFPEIQITFPVESNAIFAIIPEKWIAPLQEKFHFYTWNEFTHEVRLMCSFNTEKKHVDELAREIEALRKAF